MKDIFSEQGLSTVTFLLVITALLLIVVSVYLLIHVSPQKTLIIPTVIQPQSIPLSPTKSMRSETRYTSTVYDLIQTGLQLRCDWQIVSDDNDNPFKKGQIVIASQSARNSSEALVGKTQMHMQMIYASQSAYLWESISGKNNGYKFTQNDYVNLDVNMSAEKRLFLAQLRDSMEFTCTSWRADSGLFVVPKDIYFRTSL